jgi:L-threonylcarbamoyladenylate synthase
MTSSVDAAVEAIRRGGLAVVPVDTVYGLVCSASDDAAIARLSTLKGRDPAKPTALVAASVDAVLECVPELRGGIERVLRSLLPGPLTLVLPNPAERLPWLGGVRPGTIGVRVPALASSWRELLARTGPLAATSANLAGGRDPRRLDEVPGELLEGVDAVVDGGELPGVPSTVVDLTGAEPQVLREGAVSAADVLERVAAATAAVGPDI